MKSLKAMFEANIIKLSDNETINYFTTYLPTNDSIGKLLEDPNQYNNYKLIPIIKVMDPNDKSSTSSKRFPSIGETNTKGVYIRSSRIICSVCSKDISKRSKHPTSACAKHHKKVFMTEILVTPLE